MLTTARRLQVAALVSLLVLGASGCDDDAGSDGGPSPAGGDLTKPGSTLDLGQTARITRDSAAEVLEVTITSIDEGTSSDLAAVPSAAGETPYFVTYELRHVSGPSPYLPIDSFLSGRAGDEPVTLLSPVEQVPGCVSQTFGADAAVGTTVSGCATFVTASGAAPLDRVVLSYGDDYDAFDGHEVSWE